MKVVIIKYNAGNTKSVVNALKRLGVEPEITASAEKISRADKVILPGVGEASSAMRSLVENNLDKVIPLLKQPMLGICLGLAVLCDHSEENNTKCLGIFPNKVLKFNHHLKIPHIGWNAGVLANKTASTEDYYYFVHSYYAELGEYTYMKTDYGLTFSSALKKDNFLAYQFHPEKSAKAGAKLIENFIAG